MIVLPPNEAVCCERRRTMARQAGLVVGMLFLGHAVAGQFTQQGSTLVGTGALGAADLGSSVAISADSTTAIVGGFFDNSQAAAVL
jgi:hypothetical protein